MIRTKEQSVLDDMQLHEVVRSHLLDWEAALTLLSSYRYDECRNGVQVLQELCRFVQNEVLAHLAKEEVIVYTAVERRLPQLRDVVGQLRQEHKLFQETFDSFRRALLDFNAGGRLGELAWLGWDMVHLLRRHMEREERELHPAVLRELEREEARSTENARANTSAA